MATSYTNNLGLGKPAFADRSWNNPINANSDYIDELAPIGGLNVKAVEIPSTSLNVRVAAGVYPNSDGSKGTYAGAASQAVPSVATTRLWLDASGTLTLGTSYPTSAAHVPLATVVAGSSVITSITDDRVPGGRVFKTLVNAANDSAAAGLGVGVGCEYRNGSAVMLRIS